MSRFLSQKPGFQFTESETSIVYDLLTGEVVNKLRAHEACVRDVAWHPYRSEIVSTSWDCSVMCWNHFRCEETCSSSDSDSLDLESDIRPRSPIIRRSARLAEQRRKRRRERNAASSTQRSSRS